MPYKRNNPGNIRPGVKFKGSRFVAGDGFLHFDTAENGFRAMALDVAAKKKRGVKSILDYLKEYAPASDGNNPVAYAKTIKKKTGLTDLPRHGSLDLVNLVVAMSEVEHGMKAGPEDVASAKRGVMKSDGGQVNDKSRLVLGLALGVGVLYFLGKN